MLFKLMPEEKPILQRQLDAEQARFSRVVQHETDGEFNADELNNFRMHGLFGQIPGNDHPPVRISKQS